VSKLLDSTKEFRWKTDESAVTAHLYTNRNRSMHSQQDRSSNRLVIWSIEIGRQSAPADATEHLTFYRAPRASAAAKRAAAARSIGR